MTICKASCEDMSETTRKQCALNDACEVIEMFKDVLPAEPKKGKWELKEDLLSWEGTFDGYFCSECGKGFLSDLCCNNGADWVDVKKDFKFCPFCGADMRGETNG